MDSTEWLATILNTFSCSALRVNSWTESLNTSHMILVEKTFPRDVEDASWEHMQQHLRITKKKLQTLKYIQNYNVQHYKHKLSNNSYFLYKLSLI